MESRHQKDSRGGAEQDKANEYGESSTAFPQNDKSSQQPPNPSLPSRIGSSASSLARDMFSSTSVGAGATTSNLASLMPSEKASTSSTSRNTPSTTLAQNESSVGRASFQPSTSAKDPLGNGFRELRPETWQPTDPISFEERRWSERMPEMQNELLNSSDSTAWAEQFREESDDLQYTYSRRKLKGKEVSGDVAATAHSDGSAVVDLLNDFGSSEDDPFLSNSKPGTSAEPKPSADDLFNQPLSSSEAAIRDQILASLPPPPMHSSLQPESNHNFRPDVEMLHVPSTDVARTLAGWPSDMRFSSQEQRRDWMRQWIEEWDSVLHAYTDEVWGPDLPTVKEAKAELEELKQDERRLDDLRAVQRLKMILGHIQVPENRPNSIV